MAEAFALLRRYSQQFNVKLNEAARQVVGDRLTDESSSEHAPFQRASG
ncbi:ANTAR domain-containing protein [Terribacillus saccharophilus]